MINYSRVSEHGHYIRGVFENLSNSYDGDFSAKTVKCLKCFTTEAYLEPSGASAMEPFCENI